MERRERKLRAGKRGSALTPRVKGAAMVRLRSPEGGAPTKPVAEGGAFSQAGGGNPPFAQTAKGGAPRKIKGDELPGGCEMSGRGARRAVAGACEVESGA